MCDELRRIAAFKMSMESPGHTLQPTALVHEAWLRMLREGNEHFDGQAHFFAVAAEAMRRILVESVRRKRSLKGVPFDPPCCPTPKCSRPIRTV